MRHLLTSKRRAPWFWVAIIGWLFVVANGMFPIEDLIDSLISSLP